LKFYPNKVFDFARSYRDEEVVNTPAGERDFRNDMELVARLMGGEQVKAVGEDLSSLNQTSRANDDGFVPAAIEDGA
jgi:hypothetical protein